MNPFIAVLLVVVFGYFIYKLFVQRKSIPGAPPCLPAFPIIGSLPFLYNFDKMFECLTETKNRYGNVYGFYAGSVYTVTLCGFKAIHEALVKRSTDFAGRSLFYSERTVINAEGRGILFKNYGEHFKLNQSISLSILKEFGFADKGLMEARIHLEVHELLESIRETKGAPIHPQHVFELATMNIIYNMMFGERFNEGDPLKQMLSDVVVQMIQSYDHKCEIFPILTRLPSSQKKWADVAILNEKFKRFAVDKIKDSRGKIETNFVKEFIDRIGSDYNEKELVYILRDFILAGAESVSVTLCWAMIFIANHPEVQAKIHAEIDAMIPSDRLPSIYDMAKLPYLEAVILEVMRYRPISPLSTPHKTTCDTEVAGYQIPADTVVIINIWSAHHDPTFWPEHDTFKPERFIDDKGEIINRQYVIPFSLGKRSCPGDILARQELFLFLSGLFQSYKVLPSEGVKTIEYEWVVDLTLRPLPFDVRMIPRK